MASSGRRGLGRGLDELLPPAPGRVVQVPVDRIRPNRHQPRAKIDPVRLGELAESIARHGLLQPVVVSESPAVDGVGYELIAGERRWRAAQMAGLRTVPALVMSVDEHSRLELALVENLQREDLNAMERARAYVRLAEDFGLSHEEIASAVGKSRSAVANTIRLVALPDDAKAAVEEGRLSEGHARAILAVRDPAGRLELLRKILQQGLSVRDAEESTPRRRPRKRPAEAAADVRRIEEGLRDALGTKVELRRRGGKGRLIIHFYSDEELDAIYGLLTAQAVSRETSPPRRVDRPS